MIRFLLDTGIASDYLNKRNGVFERTREEIVKGNPIGISIPVLAELVFGIEKSLNRDRNMQLLLKNLPQFRLWPFDKAAALEYGRVAAELNRIGRPMPVIDIMTAAIAFTLVNCVVITKDSD